MTFIRNVKENIQEKTRWIELIHNSKDCQKYIEEKKSILIKLTCQWTKNPLIIVSKNSSVNKLDICHIKCARID